MKTRKRVQYHSDRPSRTQQHFKKECDVNSIMEKYRKTGMMTHVRSTSPSVGDFSAYGDFKTNLDLVRNAADEFAALPAHIRKRFNNDPANLIEFVYNDENREEAEKLGLVPQKVAPDTSIASNDDKTTIKALETSPATN